MDIKSQIKMTTSFYIRATFFNDHKDVEDINRLVELSCLFNRIYINKMILIIIVIYYYFGTYKKRHTKK